MAETLTLRDAVSPWERTVGLIGRASMSENDGMVFERCSAIHTFFMRMPIDVLFLDADRRVVRAVANLRPWRPFVGCPGAASVVELAPGEIARRGIAAGDVCEFVKSR